MLQTHRNPEGMPSNTYGDESNYLLSSVSPTEETIATAETLMSLSSTSIGPGDYQPPYSTLPFDLVIEVLSRLPVKSLMQLRCICKSWKSLISDSKFAKKQLHVAMSNTHHHHLMLAFINRSDKFSLKRCPLSSVLAEGTTRAMPLEYPIKYKNRFDQMVGSCHGILCFKIHQGLLLWNPSLRKFTKLPRLEKEYHLSYCFSFGYDNFSDSYKVVAVSSYNFSGVWPYKPRVRIYTLGVNSWKNIEDFPFAGNLWNRFFNRLGKFVTGTINWLVSRQSHSSLVIVSLDLNKESYRELLLPDFGGLVVKELNLGILKDCLCIFFHKGKFSDIWLMKEFGKEESWTKLFRVSYTQDLDLCAYVYTLYFSEDDRVLLNIEPKLVIYNSRNGTSKDTYVQNSHGWMDSEVYVESLISPFFFLNSSLNV